MMESEDTGDGYHVDKHSPKANDLGRVCKLRRRVGAKVLHALPQNIDGLVTILTTQVWNSYLSFDDFVPLLLEEVS